MLNFLKYLFKFNPFKVFFIILCFSFYTCLYFVSDEVKTSIVKTETPIVWCNHVVYVTVDSANAYTLSSLADLGADSLKVVDHKLISYRKEMHHAESFTVFMAGFLITFAFLLLAILADFMEGDSFFELDRVLDWCCYSRIKCAEENGYYFFFIGNRLIYRTNFNILGHSEISKYRCFTDGITKYRCDKRLLPIWLGTLVERRDNKLSEILEK